MALTRLETHHLIAIGYLAKPKRAGKTMDEIAAECSVDRRTLYNWLKDPLFEKELKKEMVRESSKRIPEVLESMTDAAVIDRNAQAAKLLLQVNEMLTEKMEVEQKSSQTGRGDLDDLKREVEQIDNEPV
ncbi:phBC6A51 family helix-turn-helix protein [Brevibacillus sp. HD3.3A]|uniref:phBC6A51 family helix-turn-helix protein n=1 Tax=Brevibacillus sp. HD3.3A TaxID=2738979 RepID=UPI00156B0F92|nr:phBC6A51 family helix-turn-helix protein [Brevibacillus sp. HD3.3A]UED72143.1 helix-turn-helix domain-containing protein [Brevibacillus sp. HD3.3A]